MNTIKGLTIKRKGKFFHSVSWGFETFWTSW